MKIECHDCGAKFEGMSTGNSKTLPCWDCGSWNTTVTYGPAINTTGRVFEGTEPTPECPSCGERISDAKDHETGCPKWGMLPGHWEG